MSESAGVVAGASSFRLERRDGDVALIRGPDARVREWVLGFTYRLWLCAVTGEPIPQNAHGDPDSSGWAWRVLSPGGDVSLSTLRIQRDAFGA